MIRKPLPKLSQSARPSESISVCPPTPTGEADATLNLPNLIEQAFIAALYLFLFAACAVFGGV